MISLPLQLEATTTEMHQSGELLPWFKVHLNVSGVRGDATVTLAYYAPVGSAADTPFFAISITDLSSAPTPLSILHDAFPDLFRTEITRSVMAFYEDRVAPALSEMGNAAKYQPEPTD